MSELRFEQKIPQMSHRADAIYGRWIFEVNRGLRDGRTFRDVLQTIALIAASDLHCEPVLLLDEPLLSSNRIRNEWESFTRILDPGLRKRIHIIEKLQGSELREVAGNISSDFEAWRQIVNQILQHHDTPPPPARAAALFDILRILLVHWVRRDGPVPSKQLASEAGFTYPTLASALDNLSDYLMRGPNRSVGLRRFPLDAWQKLLVNSDTVRRTRRYAVDGRPRSAEAMLSRVCKSDTAYIAVGGVLGARYWYPGIDLAGVPRLDLTIKYPAAPDRDWPSRFRYPSDDFIHQLDPALRPAERHEPAVVVVHSLFTSTTFSREDSDGRLWANEAECLLDLQEARLEAQAREFINHLTPPT